MSMDIFVTPSLGGNSYLVASGGEAAMIDPQRDAWRFLAAAQSRKVTPPAMWWRQRLHLRCAGCGWGRSGWWRWIPLAAPISV